MACLLLVAACTSTTSDPVDRFRSTAPTFPEDQETTTTTIQAMPTTTTRWLGPGSTRAALPDGTLFDVYLDPPRIEDLSGISAGIIIELDDGTSPVAGILFFSRGRIETTRWDGTTFQIRTGSDSAELEVYQHVIEAIGPGYEEVFASGIVGSEMAGYPVMELASPFRWANDEEIPLQMEVAFDTFVVRRGCGELAAACSPTHNTQVIPSTSVFSPAPPWIEGQQVWIESPGTRPVSDPWFLDPGPLSPRGAHDVIWSGDEIIVWGGASGDRRPHLVEGAAFDPLTNEWRLLPPPPIEPNQATRAVWVDDELIVMSQEATVGYQPGSNNWRSIGEGFPPAVYAGMTVFADGHVYTWTPGAIIELDPRSGVWRELPRPGFGGFDPDPWSGGLVTLDGVVYAVGSGERPCEGRLISRLAGDHWDPLPSVSLATEEFADCTSPNQTGAVDGRLIVWGDRSNPAFAYDPDQASWTETGSTTLSGSEGPLGPVDIGGRLLVPGYGEASIFDPVTDQWAAASLPGAGEDTQMAWTGEEVLAWGACCYGGGPGSSPSQDAWRWVPPTS